MFFDYCSININVTTFNIIFLSVLFITLVFNILKMSLAVPLSCERSFKDNSLFGFFTTVLLVSFNIFK